MPDQAAWIAIVLSAAVLLLVLYAIRVLRHDRLTPTPPATSPLNEMEQACLETLQTVVAGDYRIISKAPIAELTGRQGKARQVGATVDFILYDDALQQTAAAIWLHQPGSKQQDQQRQLAEQAGIPVFRLQRKTSYSILEIRRLFGHLLKKPPPSPDDMVATISMEALHLCRRCQSRMHIKRASNGAQKGSLFWVCEKFPDCRQIELYID